MAAQYQLITEHDAPEERIRAFHEQAWSVCRCTSYRDIVLDMYNSNPASRVVVDLVGSGSDHHDRTRGVGGEVVTDRGEQYPDDLAAPA